MDSNENDRRYPTRIIVKYFQETRSLYENVLLFYTMLKDKDTYSQANQDIFVSKLTSEKRDGFFVEIGSNHPIIHNNTYLLEKQYGWKGLMVEYDNSFKNAYDTYRPNSIYELQDARLVDYKKILDEHHFPKNIDYLQIDLDVNNKSTLDTLLLLDNTVFDTYTFATVTFEHDIYTGNYYNTREIARQIFEKRGYILLFPDVSVFWEGGHKPFEDWYIHPELIDSTIFSALRTNESMTSNEIRDRILANL